MIAPRREPRTVLQVHVVCINLVILLLKDVFCINLLYHLVKLKQANLILLDWAKPLSFITILFSSPFASLVSPSLL